MKPKRSDQIKYINPQVPDVKRPEYPGKRYEALVPDTIDLQEMAQLAINGLTEPTDPEADYEIYWRTNFNSNPVMMWHSESDAVQAKFMEALPLLRLASGSTQNPHVEQRWMEIILQEQGADGLLYIPKVGRPWCKFGGYGKEPPGDHYFATFYAGRILGAVTNYYLLTRDTTWKKAGQRLVDGLNKLAIQDGKWAHFPNHEFGTDGRYFLPGKPSDAVHNPAAYHGWCVQGLTNYARHTSYEPAMQLAGKFACWIRDCSNHFGEDGRFLVEYPDVTHMHFHGHTMVLLSMLDYGLTTGDQEAIEYARRGFEYAMTQGDCQLGFFAEWLNTPRPQTLEICELADMVAIAVKFSQSGQGDYWDMVDRWTRNLFYEGQMRQVDRVYWLGERIASTEIAPLQLPPYHSTDRVAERNIGAFGGWLAPNDFLPEFPHDAQWRTIGMMHCCTGNAARAIYYVWENILSYEEGKLRINLLMNRASPWADVDSHIPYTGQVDVKVKAPVELSIRIPEWVMPVADEYSRKMWQGLEYPEIFPKDYPGFAKHTPDFANGPDQVVCTVNGQSREVSWAGRYAQVGRVQSGDVVKLTFPIAESKGFIFIEKRGYRILLRGNTCVAIDPPGKNYPLFEREYLRTPQTRWRKIERFVADQQIQW